MGEITDRLLPGSLLDFGWVGVVRDGRFFVMSGWAGEELYVANPDGAITQRIGRSGQGPGEYRSPHYVLDTDSFFVVLDPSNARATHLSKDRFRVVHTTRLPASLVSRPVALRGNDYAINGIGRGSAESDPIHVIAGDGTIVDRSAPTADMQRNG